MRLRNCLDKEYTLYEKFVMLKIYFRQEKQLVKQDIRSEFKKLVIKIKYYLSYLIVWPVYYCRWSRDCDCCEVTDVCKFPTFYHAQKEIREAYEYWTEGPIRFSRITKKEYEQATPQFRDRALEAFEDGRGNNIII